MRRCMQEVVDAGDRRILKQQKRKKWERSTGVSPHIKPNGCRKLRGTSGKGKLDIETR